MLSNIKLKITDIVRMRAQGDYVHSAFLNDHAVMLNSEVWVSICSILLAHQVFYSDFLNLIYGGYQSDLLRF